MRGTKSVGHPHSSKLDSVLPVSGARMRMRMRFSAHIEVRGEGAQSFKVVMGLVVTTRLMN